MEFENPDKTGRIISVTVNTHTHTHTHTQRISNKHIHSQDTPQQKIFFDKLKRYVTPKYDAILVEDFNMVKNLTRRKP